MPYSQIADLTLTLCITKRDICIYATIKGAETIKATQIRLFGVKIAQFRSYVPKLYT